MVIAKILLMILLAGLMTLLVFASEDILTPFGRIDVMYSFRIGDPWVMLFGIGVLAGSMAIVMVSVLLMSHKPMIYGVVVVFGLTLIFFTSDFTINWVGTQLARNGDFPARHSLPQTSEILGRFQRYGILAGVSLFGFIPAYMLKGVIARGDARRFRRLLRKRRKQRAIHD